MYEIYVIGLVGGRWGDGYLVMYWIILDIGMVSGNVYLLRNFFNVFIVGYCWVSSIFKVGKRCVGCL